jgi:peptidyl-tRNA hydrolase, PTH1 family
MIKNVQLFKKKQEPLFLVVGLGNPKDEYQDTRHNVGFQAIDQIVESWQLPDLSFESKFNAWIIKDKKFDENIVFAKPMTFMNLSGKAVFKITHFYKTDRIIVIHDDIDLPLGKIKIVENKGAGGHKGVESIIKEINSKNFIRIRVGISPQKKPSNTTNFVLQRFKKNEKEILEQALTETIQALALIVQGKTSKAASLFNK